MLARENLYLKVYQERQKYHKKMHNWGIAYSVLATIFPPVNAIYTARLAKLFSYSYEQEFKPAQRVLFGVLGSIIPFFSTYYSRRLLRISDGDRRFEDPVVKRDFTVERYEEYRNKHKENKAIIESTNQIKLELDKSNKPKKVVVRNGDNVEVYMDKRQADRRNTINVAVMLFKDNDQYTNLIKSVNNDWYKESYNRSHQMVSGFSNNR